MNAPRDGDVAGVVAPPPLLLLAALALGGALDYVDGTGFLPDGAPFAPRVALGGTVAAAGVALAIAAALRFRRAGTAVEPWKPSRALALDGPYRFTRNPMYLGMMLVALGAALALDGLWMLLAAALLFAALHFGVVLREERYLAARFGADYDAFRRRVRRWL